MACPLSATPILRQACRQRPGIRSAHRAAAAAVPSRPFSSRRKALAVASTATVAPIHMPAAPIASACRAHSTSPASPSPSATPSSSVSPDEVAHFNALAATWWDPYGSSRLLHQMNPLRHDFIRQCARDGAALSQPNASASSTIEDLLPRRYLDIGCGGGIFAESAARLPTTTSVTAIDPSPEVLAIARSHARRDPVVYERLSYRQASIEDLTSAAGTTEQYDIVSLFEVIEHVATDPGAFLDRCGRLLKPGGWLVMSTMARTWTSWLTTVVAAEDVLGIVPRGTHDWNKYINADELSAYFAPGAPAYDTATWQNARFQGVAYVPGLGWKGFPGGEKVGNYFFGIQKIDDKPR